MKYWISILTGLTICFSACNYLDMVPEKDIETIETVFEQREQADAWLRGVYAQTIDLIADISQNPVYFGADEFVTGEPLRNSGSEGKLDYPGFKIAEGLQMSQEPYGNIWCKGGEYGFSTSFYENIRSCNIFLENIKRVYNMKQIEKDQWAAEIKALKAYCYFELVRRYGPIVLAPETIPADADILDMQLPRSHVDTCFKEIVRLLDEAAEDLLPGNERTSDRSAYFSKEAALALKARVLLYAASPLFNGNEFYSDFKEKNGEPLFSTTYDPEKWRLAAEAADAAVAACDKARHDLYRGTTGRGSDLLNVMYDVEQSVLSEFSNPESILEWKDPAYQPFYMLFLPRFKSTDTDHYNSKILGCVSPSMTMVEMYYTENGLPIDMDNSWDYTNRYRMSKESNPRYNQVVPLNSDVLQLHLRREPRFYASIAADRTYWRRGPVGNYVDYNLLVKAYKGEQLGSQQNIVSTADWQNINGYWIKKYIYSDKATSTYSVSQNETRTQIRLAELYLIQAEAWNEYLETPDDRVYGPLNKVRERAGIPDVKTSWKSYSKMPSKVDTKEGMRDIIRQEINIELAFEGHRFWNLRRWKIAHEVLNEKQMGWNILGETAQSFYNNFNGPVVVWNKCKFTSPRDYLFPIKAEEVLISGVVQNPNW